MSNDMYDVVQIGYGPVGQTMAALLGKAGHRVAVFERWPELFGKARAGHVDHEIMRIFQSVGAADAVEEDAARATKYEFRNAAGELLLSFDWDFDGISGWPSDYIVYQPTIETALHDAVSQLPTVEVHQGWEAVAIEPQNDHVDITLRRVGRSAVGKKVVTDDERTVSARYVIGADGANSFVRDIIGTDQHDFGFQETWLVLDLKPTAPLHFDFDNGQICDPARPHCLFQLGKRHRRFEFCLLPGETPEQMSDPATAWALVEQYGVTPDNAELVRHAVYTFKSKLADTWMDSCLLLIGDAAHVMPPFMGQGMCSGVRDANNLAWKLDSVLRGLSDPAILGSYRDERAPHVSSIINMSIEAGKISCTTDPSVAAARDEAFRTGQVPPPPPFPHLESGILAATDTHTRLRGQLAPQGRIALDGREGRFDDLVGTGWTLLISGHIVPEFSAEQQATLDRLEVRVVTVAESAINSAATDVDGYYTKYFAANAVIAVLYRPDFYIFGAADDLAAVGTLIDELGSLVPPRVQAALA